MDNFEQDKNYTYETRPVFDNQIVMLSYLSLFISAFIAPLIIWAIKKDDDPETGEALADVLNFTLSYTIYTIISSALMVLVIGFITTPILGVMVTIFTIIGAVKSANGERYLPPLTIRFIK
ncbi:DUF4870 domain-containing protein [Nosocomiicoccus ampullae]|uniref:DUF4870 domain-containing protein n=1 Tax=Nosocomiicoccus ampullae TaxID=489910 RepID=A0A9Q2HF52_9STAP|nr:DUF4870 domain-containing protein [Nosocomiicoccus ampullae]MBB5175778.1 hypothetical protein [Nosocomiicoccus ampullae]QYA47162.1 DUF4870 domain-containing protein [Nosocomiicoccus ampullae]HJB79030.1 DUF4870 domain-containing protein [Candidatus Nosocomiicoccus stercorigallinarum]